MPHSIVLDKDGRIAYIGHPMDADIESALDKVRPVVAISDIVGLLCGTARVRVWGGRAVGWLVMHCQTLAGHPLPGTAWSCTARHWLVCSVSLLCHIVDNL